MKITNIRLGRISVPLRVPFKTAVRSVSSVEDVIVEIHTDTPVSYTHLESKLARAMKL